MIPFASQRGNGQDLATHLLNTHDNEQLEIAHLRGAVSDNLNGAFAEWELQAKSLTKCEKYLYSLSINPDPEQGQLTREQYEDYIGRVEDKLGLSEQPRAIVYHTKNGREHAHVVWSRIDAEAGKAVQLSYDKEKLMKVTREFARDHSLSLPNGYERDGHSHDQLSLYEKSQQEKTGVTKEERIAHVTEAWQQSDSPKAFVQALSERGYILATGKRPYLVVDIYGEVNALPKLIGDKEVRAKNVQEFLSEAYPTEKLPTVEQARKLAEQHRKAREAFIKSQRKPNKINDLKEKQAERREAAFKEAASKKAKQAADHLKLAARQQAEHFALQGQFKAEMDRIARNRELNRPTGLAAFLGRVTGVNLIIKKLQERNDKKRQEQYEKQRQDLLNKQETEKKELEFIHQMQSLAQERKIRALDRLDRKEINSLRNKQLSGERTGDRDGYLHLPVFGNTRKLEKDKGSADQYYPDMQDRFTSASGKGDTGGKGGGGRSGGGYKSVFKKDRKIAKQNIDKDSGKDR